MDLTDIYDKYFPGKLRLFPRKETNHPGSKKVYNFKHAKMRRKMAKKSRQINRK